MNYIFTSNSNENFNCQKCFEATTLKINMYHYLLALNADKYFEKKIVDIPILHQLYI